MTALTLLSETSHNLSEMFSTLTFWVVSVPFIALSVVGFLKTFKSNIGTPFFEFIRKMSKGFDKINDLEKKVDEVIRTQQEVAAERFMEFQINEAPMFECDEVGNNIRVNRAYCELFSLSDPTQAGRYNWSQLIHERDRAAYVAEWRRSLETKSMFRYRAMFVDTDGNEVGLMDSRAWPMFTPDNRFLKYRGFLDFSPVSEQQDP